MSILSDALSDIFALLFPVRCIGCNCLLNSRRDIICSHCLSRMPFTLFHTQEVNEMEAEIKRLRPEVQSAAAQFYFARESRWRRIIHEIKYHHAWRAAYYLGYRYGLELKKSSRFKGIEVIVPVPLHPWRQMGRGYNQSELIARGMAKALGAKVNSSSLKRIRYNKSQVKTSQKEERWQNVKGIFALRHPKRLEGRNILLVDDVFTTGATMIGCIDTVRQACNCKIWVATLSISRAEIVGNSL